MKELFLASTWQPKPRSHRDRIETMVAGWRSGLSMRCSVGRRWFTVVDWKTGARPTVPRCPFFPSAGGLPLLRPAEGRCAGPGDAAFYYAGTGETVFPFWLGTISLPRCWGRFP